MVTHTQQDIIQEDDLFIYTGRQTIQPVDLLNGLFKRAVEDGVVDIHFQQTQLDCRVRFRICGILHDIETVDLIAMQIIDDKIRSRARISTTDRRTPHDGRMSLSMAGTNIDVRVSITPGVSDGQLIVCRILNQSNSNMRLDDIEMTAAAKEAFHRLIEEPNGLFLITGPTGSGKTTTLYAMLNELNDESRNIITIENPVEYRIKQFHQINVDGDTMTFAKALRAVLRQDPDVIMVGEIRDLETAHIAFEAALTGHLVLATMHANNAPLAITRLVEMGIDIATIASALRGVTAQRLVRTIAPHAEVTMQEPNESEKKWLHAINSRRNNPLYPKVHNSIKDYRGVLPVMEIVLADPRVKKAFEKGEAAIYEAASRQPQFETLGQAAERLAFLGYTTLDEARRTASIHESPVIANKRIAQVLMESGKISAHDVDRLLAMQAQDRKDGNPRRIGEMLLAENLCTYEDIQEAVGFTAEAYDVLQKICLTEDKKQLLTELSRRWSPGKTSLFLMALDEGLVNNEEIAHATIY
jgi:general secretion pathway protein E